MIIQRTIIVLIILHHLMRIITPQQCIYLYHDSAMKASGKNLDSQSVLNLIAFKLASEYFNCLRIRNVETFAHFFCLIPF